MDGRFDQTPSPAGWYRRVPSGWFYRLTILTVVCLCLIEMVSPIKAADHPSLFRRSLVGSRSKRLSKTDVPPSPESPEIEADSKPVIATAGEHQDRSQTSREIKIDSSGSLNRFPQKSARVKSTLNNDTPEKSIGVESAVTPIDLPAALQLAGWNSPEVLLAQQRVLAVTARQQLAAAQALPNLNLGTNYDSHTGVLQQSSGAILNVQRSTLYVGGGGNAVGAGTVNLPGLQYNLNVGEAYFNYLVSRQLTERQRASAEAASNNVLLQIASAYCRLVREQGARAIAVKVRDEALEVARITSTYEKVGQGRPADAERAATEVGVREADILATDAAIIEASAKLGRLLNLESSVRLQSNENWIVPRPVVPDLIPLPELIAIALYRRPEIAERRAEVHAAMLELDNAKLLLFSPQFIGGFSDGAFGGGSNLVAATGSPRFGNFGDRTDVDLILYWSIRNLGLANRALINSATARLAATDWERTKRLNDIRAEVADAYARTQSRAAQLDIRVRAVSSSERGFREDLNRASAGEGRPIEVLDSLRLRARAQLEYLDTIAAYNQAQYELYVAIGQPPADLLIHSNPPSTPLDRNVEGAR